MTTTRACSCGAVAHYQHPETGPDLCVTCHHDLSEGAQVNLERYAIIPNPNEDEEPDPTPEPPSESLHWRLTGYAGALDTSAKEGLGRDLPGGTKMVQLSATFAHRLAQEMRRAALWVGEYVPTRWTGAPLPLDYDPRVAPREQACPYCEKETLARRASLPGHWTCTECEGCYADSLESLADAAIASSPLLSRVVGCRHAWAERVSMSREGAQFEGLVCSRCGLETILPGTAPQVGMPLCDADTDRILDELGSRIAALEVSKIRSTSRHNTDLDPLEEHLRTDDCWRCGRCGDEQEEGSHAAPCKVEGCGGCYHRYFRSPAAGAPGENEPQDPLDLDRQVRYTHLADGRPTPLEGTTGFETQTGDLDGGSA